MRRGRQNFEGNLNQEISQLLALSDDERKELCYELLQEFGANNVTEHGDELNHSCCLPFGFHRNGDQNPSANLNWRKLTYKCHGCGEGGGIAWFITACRGGDYSATKQWLTGQTQVGTQESLHRLLAYMDSLYEVRDTKSDITIPKYDPSILEGWRFIHPYLTEGRHIPIENIINLQIGYDHEQDRIILPHFWEGQLVGWQTRQIKNDGGPKYKNTPDFPKNETLYHAPPDTRSHITVVESVLSVASKIHLEPNMTATFGASVTDRQKYLLSRYPRVTLWFDNDPAGWKATEEVGSFLIRYTNVLVVESDWNADPADLDDETFSTTLANVIPFSLWQHPTQLKEAPHGNP